VRWVTRERWWVLVAMDAPQQPTAWEKPRTQLNSHNGRISLSTDVLGGSLVGVCTVDSIELGRSVLAREILANGRVVDVC
jgi:hypothetical protein